ncbi:MAG: S28 family serine protease [Bacteroidales bacterium]|nr:S28 family serine protease [Bacteroidales bacterium]
MKKRNVKFILASLVFVALFTSILMSCDSKTVTIENALLDLDGGTYTELESRQPFNSVYELHFRQPLDHSNPDAGYFTQKVYVSHIDSIRPVVFITEGYTANRPYQSELSRLTEANQIIVEHRFFGESIPDPKDWKYLTVEQAANDHHKIVEFFKKVYTGKWINTGISKGGQTTMYHRYFFPDDVDVSVPYVGPLNFSFDDPRTYLFLDTVGTPECRQKVYDYQAMMLKKRDIFYPMFVSYCESKNQNYTRVSQEEAYEYSILEYSFAFWQWGRWTCEEIPNEASSNEEIFDHFKAVSGFQYFSDQGILDLEPFFYQAMTEIGYYGYDFSEFEGLLEFVTNPIFTFAAPQDVELVYDFQIMKDVNSYLQSEGDNFIYIYGGSDTWSSTSVEIGDKTNALKIYKEGGAHNTRISNLPNNQKELVVSTLENWLEMDIDISKIERKRR